MPPSRSAQETLDWITFTTGFVQAAASVDMRKLDEALEVGENEYTFTEALGLGLSRTQDSQREMERHWASDTSDGLIDWTQLVRFVDCDDGVWTRIIAARDQIERELAALPS